MISAQQGIKTIEKPGIIYHNVNLMNINADRQ